MAGRHRELVEELRSTIGYARGAARAAVATARQRATQRRGTHRQVEQESQRAGQRLLAGHARRLAEADQRCLTGLRQAAAELSALIAGQASGAASAPWQSWSVTAPARDQAPGLYRIGRLTAPHDSPGRPGESVGLEAPALVSLLDLSHLVVLDPGHQAAIGLGLTAPVDTETGATGTGSTGPTGHRPTDAVHALISTVLLRVLGCTPPGSVHLTVYDPEHLGGGLAGFAPLAAAGLLTFVGPGGLGRLLDDLVEQIRRINETVLAGEYGSLRELAAATGRRPEPWRVAVLLGGDELEPARARASWTGWCAPAPACGVHLVVAGYRRCPTTRR